MKLGYSIIILIVVAVGVFFLTNNDESVQNNQNQQENMTTENTTGDAPKDLGEELLMTVIKEGTGEEAKNGDLVSVNYSGFLLDGTKFDSSIGRAPFEFTIGAGEVIKGWDVGVSGMKVGEVRKLSIPADMAYGERGAGDVIPPNATLIFEVELLEIK